MLEHITKLESTFTTNDHNGAIFVSNTNLAINILTLSVPSHYKQDRTGKVRLSTAQVVLVIKIAP